MNAPSQRDAGRSSSRRPRRLIKVVLWLLLVPLLAFGGSNLWLNTSWGKDLAAAKLKARTGMDWEVHGMTWSPWNGFTVNGATMLQPEQLRAQIDQPLLEVEQIHVQPYWSQLIRGRARFREISVDAPSLTVTVEMLAAMASSAGQLTEPPPAPATEAQVGPVSPSVNPSPNPEITASPKSSQPINPAPAPAAKPEVAKPEVVRPPAGLAMRLRVTNASLKVVSLSKDIEVMEAEGIDLDIPLLGEDAEGMIRLGEIKIPGIERIHDIEQAIAWKRPYLEIEEQTVNLAGLELRFVAQLAMVRDVPFLFDLVIDPQGLEDFHGLEQFAIDLNAEKMAGRIRAVGAISSPMTWRSSAIFFAEKVTVQELHGHNTIKFDDIAVPVVFQHGVLQWSSARAIGEDISVLGNGSVSMRDGVAAVTRLVVSPEVGGQIHKALMGAHISNSWDPWWEYLDTPDRQFRDIHVHGSLMEPVMDLGSNHEEWPLWQTIAATMHFVRVEMKEEGVDIKPLPNEELLRKKSDENH
ncbi:hypothetical protein NT6N_08650 [Oceaniferula spumae]|uniref:AsmA-like C-terminal domain-containing protein n=1 Tax=Oceaniferula spumae TaxID=2979115 RepID=A0AAT9FIK5_9BACT